MGRQTPKLSHLGHQDGEPPWAVVASAQSKAGNQWPRGQRTETATHQETTGQAHGRRQAGNQAREQGPRRGLGIQIQVGRGELPRASRRGPAVRSVRQISSVMLECNL